MGDVHLGKVCCVLVAACLYHLEHLLLILVYYTFLQLNFFTSTGSKKLMATWFSKNTNTLRIAVMTLAALQVEHS
jgi:hypothetical protein